MVPARRAWCPATALGLSLLTIAVPAALGQELSDIRPPALKEAEIDAESAARARELVARMLEAHGGLVRFRSFTAAEVVARDDWPSAEARAQYMPWPENDQRIRYQFLLGTFDSRAEILEGEGKGEVRGIQNWMTYRKAPGGDAVFSPDPLQTFFLPTYQYFFELPFRMAEVPIVGYGGEETFLGEPYHRVLATWETPEPHPEHDQYLLWIHAETGRLDLVQYTIREFMPSAIGAIHLEDFRQVQGLLLPFRQTIGPPGGDRYLHRIQLEEVVFTNDLPRTVFFPDPSRSGTKPGPAPARAP